MSEPRDIELFGLSVTVDDAMGHLCVYGDGLSWDILQRVKNAVWGDEARAIEVYPRASELVNNAPCRHLWLLGDADFAPDLLGRGADRALDWLSGDRLEGRYRKVWQAADEKLIREATCGMWTGADA